MSNSVNQILQAKNSSLKETTQHRLLHDLLTLYSFSEELVFTVGYIKKRKYSVKIKNEKYKKAFTDFYNRLPVLELFTSDTDSQFVEELLNMMNTYCFTHKIPHNGNK